MDQLQVGSIYYDLTLEKGSFDRAISSVNRSLSSLNGYFKSAEQGSKQFAYGLVGLATSIGGVGLIGVKYAGELENLQTALETVTGSTEKASKAMEVIKKTAQDSPFFETKTLAEFVQLMSASGMEIEKAVQSSIGFGDVASAFGKGNAEMARMGNTLSQVIGKGKADIVDFKELVNAGWVSVKKDTAEALGVTMAQFEDMVSAGEVGYEDIEKASQKFAGSAKKSSGNLTSIWNRMLETMQTQLSTLVIDTGIFDAIKEGMQTLITFVENNSGKITEFIINSFSWIQQNAPVIIGLIVGGLTPALYGLAGSLIAVYGPLIPFIAIGGAIAYLIKLLIDHFGGLNNVLQMLQPAWESLKDIFNKYILPSLNILWDEIKNNLLPALKQLWDLIQPYVIPTLKVLGVIIGAVLIVAINLLIGALILITKYLTMVVNSAITWQQRIVAIFNFVKNIVSGNIIPEMINGIVNWFKKLPQMISNALSGLKDAMLRPFKSAFDAVSKEAGKLKDQLNKINPFNRNSPSLVDNVKRGVGIIADEYSSLADIKVPKLSETIKMPEMASNTNNNNYTLNIGNVRNESDIESISKQLGFQVSLGGLR